MTSMITLIYYLAAASPIIALAWNALEATRIPKELRGIAPGTNAYLNATSGSEHLAAARKRGAARQVRDLALVGFGVVAASVAGILSLPTE